MNSYNNIFGPGSISVSDLTPAELALIERAANSPAQAFGRQRTFAISSAQGLIAPGNFGLAPGLDIDGNGIDDCRQSYIGRVVGFGLGGCWVVNNDGTVRPYQDGQVATLVDQFGGDGINLTFDNEYLLPSIDRANFNLNTRYDITPDLRAVVELSYSYSDTAYYTPYNGFFDLNYGAPDNPFLPPQLQALAQSTGGLWINRDNIDSLGRGGSRNERQVMRIVGGFEGTLPNGWNWEVFGNYGRYEQTLTSPNKILLDRWFAAIDVVTGPNGQPVCRSDLDPTAIPPTNAFNDFPNWADPGFWSFTPGSGQCQPANIWGGQYSISQAAIDFITVEAVDRLVVQQTVFNALLTGDSSQFFTLPAGPIGFALGAEYRREESRYNRNPWDLGIMPAGAPFPAGTLLNTVSGNEGFGFFGASALFNSSGSYDVTDVFAEISVPLLSNQLLAEELTFDAAYRYAEYSTLGGAETWKLGLVWTPVSDISFRTTLSQAIRAPNIDELFRPNNIRRFGPVDPCEPGQIAASPNPQLRAQNCQTGGGGLPALPPGFVDPNTAAFVGATGGNPALTEETADTFTIGFVLTPRFVPGLSITLDYWDVEISDGIAEVGAQDIVDICYDSSDFPNNPFCSLFTRSQTTGGLNFLLQAPVNFAAIEARGYDLAASYGFSLGENDFRIGLVGTKQEVLRSFSNPVDPNDVTILLERLQRPKWAGNLNLGWQRGPLSLGWQTQYQSRQGLAGVNPVTAEAQFGDAAFVGNTYIHNFNGSFRLNDSVRFYGGVNNVEDRRPFITETAWPVGPRGRYFFLGVEANF